MNHHSEMGRKLALIIIITVSFWGSYAGQRYLAASSPWFFPRQEKGGGEKGGRRIISLAPSVTETLFALGLAEEIAGVTRYCRYPEKVRSLPAVGGYFDPSYEAIVSLRPHLVVLLVEQETARQMLEGLGIPTLVVNHRGVQGILDSPHIIGRATGAQETAEHLERELQAEIERIKAQVAGRRRPGVLVSVGRDMGQKKVGEVYISGADGFYHDLIILAGGRNVYSGKTISYPTVSAEAIVRMNPEVIIEIAPRLTESGLTAEEVIRQWESVPEVSAVKNQRIYVFTADYTAVPGPRFIQTLSDFARAIHPEVFNDEGKKSEETAH